MSAYTEDTLIDKIRELETEITKLKEEASQNDLLEDLKSLVSYCNDTLGCCGDCDLITYQYVVKELNELATS